MNSKHKAFSNSNKKKVEQTSLRKTKKFYTLFFIAPAIIVILTVLIFPLFGAIYLSFNDIVRQKLVFVGFKNYLLSISNQDIWNALFVNLKFTFFSVFFSFILGFILALLLNEIRFSRFFRLVFLMSWPTMSVVTGLVFAWMFNAQFGVINEILVKSGVLSSYISWFGKIQTAFPIVISASVWKESPFYMIMILAGMKAIPKEQYEAARVDGANSFQLFRYITLPYLKNVIKIALMLQIIWRFREFDIVQVMTRGGPNKGTEVFSVLVYRYCFRYIRFGEGAAIAVLMTTISMFFTVVYLKLTARGTQDD